MIGFIIQEFFILYVATKYKLKPFPVISLSLLILILNLTIQGIGANFIVGVLNGAILFYLVSKN